MNIILNGVAERLPEPLALAEYLKQKKLAPEHLIIELNGEILPDALSPGSHYLQEGDVLNLFSVVAGG